MGEQRNWDYRYTWVRDASFTLSALWVAACPDEAGAFFEFMVSAAAQVRDGGRLQIMYGIGGEHDLAERQLEHLAGWRPAARCGWATPPGGRSSSTSTGNCWTLPTGCSPNWVYPAS